MIKISRYGFLLHLQQLKLLNSPPHTILCIERVLHESRFKEVQIKLKGGMLNEYYWNRMESINKVRNG